MTKEARAQTNVRVGDRVWVRHRAYWRLAKVVKLYESGPRFCRVQFLKVVDARDNGKRWPEARDIVFTSDNWARLGKPLYPELRTDTPPREEMGAEWKYETEAFG